MPSPKYPYLVAIHIPFAVEPDGTVLTGEMWIRDLRGMAAALGRVAVAAPCVDRATLQPERTGSFRFGRVAPDDPELSFLPLPLYNSAGTFVRQLRETRRRLATYIADAGLVHADSGGWPISQGELAIREAHRQGKPVALFLGDGADPIGRFREKMERERGIKKVTTWLVARHFERYFRRASARVELTAFHNPVTERRFARFARRHISFNRSFVDDGMILGEPELKAKLARIEQDHELSLLMAGRLIPMKGIDQAIRALAAARERGADVRLTVLGSGADEPRLRKLAAEMALEEAIDFAGTVEYGPELFDVFRRHHGLVVCNLTDELSRNVLLGMAFGSVVLGYENPSMAHVCEHGRNAWLATSGSIDELADGFVELWKDRKKCQEFVIAGLRTARRNTFSACHARRAEAIRQHIPGVVSPEAPGSPSRCSIPLTA